MANPITYDEFLKRYDQLDTLEQTLVEIFSFVSGPGDKGKVLDYLKWATPDLFGKVRTLTKLTDHMRELVKKGFLDKDHCIVKELTLFASFQASRSKNGKKVLGRYLWRAFDLSSMYGLHINHLIMKLKVSIFLLDDKQGRDEAYSGLMNYYRHVYHKEDPLILFTATPFIPEIFSSFSNDVQILTLNTLFYKSSKTIEDDSAILAYTKDFLKSATPSDDWDYQNLVLHLAVRLIHHGQVDEAFELSKRAEFENIRLYLESMATVYSGDYTRAMELFTELVDQHRKFKREKEPVFLGTPGYLYTLVRFATANPAELPVLSAYISKKCLKVYRNSIVQSPYYYLGIWVDETIKPGRENFKGFSDFYLDQIPETLLIYVALAEFGIAGSLVEDKLIQKLKSLYSRAKKLGYDGLVIECAEMLLRSGHGDGSMADEADQLKKKSHYVPLSNLVESKELWEKKVDALLGVLSLPENAATKASSASRLIWVVDIFGRGNVDLTPLEQKMGAHGRWTKGKAVSLTRIESGKNLDCMTEGDKRIARSLKSERQWGGSYVTFDMDLALPSLVGHPLVFEGGNVVTPVEVVKGEPELRVKKVKSIYHISFKDKNSTGRSIIEKEGPGRFKVVTFNDDQIKIREILGDAGIRVPEKGKDRLLEVIGALSSKVLIQSDVGGVDQSFETIKAESTPAIHLFPSGEGFGVSIHVRPFGEDGPLMKPGRGGKAVIADIKGRKLQAERDLNLEKRNAAEVVSDCVALSETDDGSGQWMVDDTETCLELLSDLKTLKDQGKVVVVWPEGEKLKPPKTFNEKEFKFRITSRSDWFDIAGDIELDQDVVLDLKKLLELLDQSSSRYIPLGDGEFLALSETFRRRLKNLSRFATKQKGKLGFHRSAALAFQDSVSGFDMIKGDKVWKDLVSRLEQGETFTPDVPSTVTAQLRDYQTDGFVWLSRLAMWSMGACLADDMGLGKTLQALCVLVDRASLGPSLVVCPTSVCMNWMDEAARFAPTLRPVQFGTGNREDCIKSLGPMDVLVSSYGLLYQEIERLSAVSWNVIILDEAQAIKNAGTKRSQAAMTLSGQFRVITTGTPVENHLGELKNLFDFINPGLLGSDKHFNETFASPMEKNKDKEASKSLRNLIRPFMLRRIKTQVLDELPPKTEITLHVELSAEETAFYEALRQKAVESLTSLDSENKGEKHLMILAEITRLRRACCHPDLVVKDSGVGSSKLAQFGELVDELLENRHKVLVFSQFTSHLAILKDHLDKRSISYRYLDGSTPTKQRRQEVDAFQRGEGDLFLISLKAGGMGLNLTAASYVIHMDPWWNPAVEDQASDRAHRIGQLHPVTVYRLVAKNTIEEKIIDLHRAKRDLAEELLEGGDISGKISAEELMSLIRA